MSDSAGQSSWWKSGLFAVVIGAAIPVATFVQGWLQKDRELALQERQQLQQFRSQYMSVVAEAGVEGIAVLADFIADTEENEKIREWATRQRDSAKKKIQDLDTRIEAEQKSVKAAEDAADAASRKTKQAEEKLARLAAQAKEDKVARELAEANATEERKDLPKAKASVAVNETKLFRSRDALVGKVAAQSRMSQVKASAATVKLAPRLQPDD